MKVATQDSGIQDVHRILVYRGFLAHSVYTERRHSMHIQLPDSCQALRKTLEPCMVRAGVPDFFFEAHAGPGKST